MQSVGKDKYSEQTIQNFGFDETYKIPIRLKYVYNPATGNVEVASEWSAVATKITVVGSITYVGIAAPGTAQADAKWQCKKIDETSGIVITWADGDANFDNVVTDLTALSYL